MKKQTIISIVGGCLLAFSTQIALAEDIPVSSAQMSSILQSLQAKGYNNVKKIKFTDGKYEARAVNAQGKIEKLDINAQTGAILDGKKPAKKMITALEVATKVEAAGYRSIYKLEADSGKYEVRALDKDGKKVELEIDATTGEIKKD
ncbi:MAG: hypothetical protein K0Q74_170 [Gammaproteobacteria bacterium]|jgi:hypothetical protein|nr:hypothetical protein [Gammaproteobacteria bacterium]